MIAGQRRLILIPVEASAARCQIGGLLHDVLAREIVAALLEDLQHGLADRIVTTFSRSAGLASGGHFFRNADVCDGLVVLPSGSVGSFRKSAVMSRSIVEPAGAGVADTPDDGLFRKSAASSQVRGLDRRNGELDGSDVHQGVRTRSFQVDDLRIDGGIGGLISLLHTIILPA
jgi:hypothetical protein